jgi:hypothetical protein
MRLICISVWLFSVAIAQAVAYRIVVTGGIISTTNGVIQLVDMAPKFPSSITGLVMRLDADQETGYTNGAAVTTWTDRSGNGNHATNGSAIYATMDADGLAGKKAVRFTPVASNGVGMFAPSLALHASDQTVFCVANAATATAEAYHMLFSLNQHAAGLWVGRRPQSVQWRANAFNNSASVVPAASTWTNNVSGVIVTLEKSAAGGMFYYQGGVLLASNVTAAAKANYTAGPTHIGGMPEDGLATARTWDGCIGEFVVYNRLLSADERLTVEAYLKAKWGTP